ncbi:MAG: metal ABC transporter solute-binding protein, Zn/Mn family, partial [Verrucomicrobium sp.]
LPTLAAVAGLVMASCKPSAPAPSDGKPFVVTTTTMITDMVKEIGGDHIYVEPLMGPGVDPHLYKPTAEDARKLREAKATFYNGLMLEGRMSELFESSKKDGRKVYELGSAINEANRKHAGEHHYDPHIWGDPRLWVLCVDVVIKGLSEVDPANAADYAKRGAETKASYTAAFEWCQQRVAQIPPESRVLITSHDAFAYFGDAFGFQVVGVQGISTVSEAGLADVAKTVDFIKGKKVKAIFVESSVPHATIERISKDSGAKIGGELYSDALGTPKDMKEVGGEQVDQGTYVGMIKSNVHTVVEALK